MTLRRTPMKRSTRNTGPNQATRHKVWQRDNWCCALCGTSSGVMEIHHRKARSRGGDNRLSNLLLLCSFGGCHDLIAESQRTRSRLNGWLVDTAFDPADVPLIWHGQLVWLCDDGTVKQVGEEASPHYTEHLALLREEAQRPCASCAVPFVSTNPRRLLCTNCQRASRRAS